MARRNAAYVGQRVIVAGGSDGIGRAISIAFAEAGADVSVLPRSRVKLDAVLVELDRRRPQPAQRFETRSVDVRDWEATRSIVEAFIADQGVPDIVVDTAGYARPGYASDLGIEHYRSMMDKPADVLKAEESVSTVDPEVVAAALLRRLPSDPFIITATLDSRVAQLLIRLAPWVADRALRRPTPEVPSST